MHIAAHVTFRVTLLHYLKRTGKPLEKPSYITIKAELVIRVPAAASTSEQYIRKTVGDEATTSGIGKKWHHQNAALYHMCICFSRWFGFFTSVSRQLGNTHTY